jgi:hypothetical protein
LKTANFACLKKAALLALSIRDIVDRAGVSATVFLVYSISDDMRGVFVKHFEYLRTGGYPRHRSNPVFPKKERKGMGPRQLQYD